jgi:hypothetical protein
MASTAQVLANQKNAALSTGPRTADGKAASARNATRHGLSSGFRVLAHEDQHEFDELLESLRAFHRPRDIHQDFLVLQMAQSRWLLARARRLQAVAYDLLAGAEDPSDPETRIVQAMRDSYPDVVGRFERYAASAERSYYKAERELAAARQRQNEAEYEGRLKARVVERMLNAPLPVPPAAAIRPHSGIQRNEANPARPQRLSDAELALRL